MLTRKHRVIIFGFNPFFLFALSFIISSVIVLAQGEAHADEMGSERVTRDNHVSRLIYVNRCEGGCIFTPGPSDARSNISSIVEQTSSLSEFPFSDRVFEETIACLKDVYEPYDVEIITEDPGDVFHHEAVLAGTSAEIGREPSGGWGSGGGTCTPKDNGVSFTFPITLGNNPETLCSVLAQETAHSFGLSSHTFNCHDPMTYLRSCGRQYFRNIRYPCGEFSQDPQCRCGGNTRNNHVMLTNALGRSDVQLEKPELVFFEPSAGENVSDGFQLGTISRDKRGIQRVEVWFSGSMVASQLGNLDSNTNPNTDVFINFEAPEWPDGFIDIEVRAYNDLEDFSSEITRVLKGEACTSNEVCNVGQECIEGGCQFPTAIAGLTDECRVDENCLEGVCIENDGQKACALSCSPDVQDACDPGFVCTSNGGCVEESKDSSGFCSAGLDHGSLALMLLGLLGLFRFRRERKVLTS